MRRFNLTKVSLRDLLVVGLPTLLLIVVGFWAASRFIKPGPPQNVVITTGVANGAYTVFAERYKEVLARNGIKLEIRTSQGSIENVQRLKDGTSGVDIGFIQAGILQEDEESELMSLGNVYYEPVWVFYRASKVGKEVNRLTQLKGKRIAIGGESSGTQLLALQLLLASGFQTDDPNLVTMSGEAAESALEKGEVDVVFFISAPEALVIDRLMRVSDVKLMNFSQADAYSRRMPFLSLVTLPEGAMDMVKNLPSEGTTLVAPTAHLVARNDLHPALVSLLAQALQEVHGPAGLFAKSGEFPAFRDHDFPQSTDAQYFYKNGQSFLQRYLPFWIAVFVERALVLLIPLIALLIPAARLLPTLYEWRIRSRIFRLYGELKELENDIRAEFSPAREPEFLQRLSEIEDKANGRPIPLSHTNELYFLREHINLVREVLVRQVGKLR